MIKIFTEIFFSIRNYKSDENLTEVMNLIMKGNIVQVTEIDHKDDNRIVNIDIVFDNGYQVIGWHLNRFYAWLTTGDILYDGEVIYQWKNKMLSRRSTFKLIRKIFSFYKGQGKSKEFISEKAIRDQLNDIVKQTKEYVCKTYKIDEI